MEYVLNVKLFIIKNICDIVIFVYKIGESLLDSTIRPYILAAVCDDFANTATEMKRDWFINAESIQPSVSYSCGCHLIQRSSTFFIDKHLPNDNSTSFFCSQSGYSNNLMVSYVCCEMIHSINWYYLSVLISS